MAQEIGQLHTYESAFSSRNTRVLGLCIGELSAHEAFMDDIRDTTGAEVPYPILADVDGSMCRQLGAVHPRMSGSGHGRHAVRSLFIFSPSDGGAKDLVEALSKDGVEGVKVGSENWTPNSLVLSMHYPPTVGRNWDEVIRAIDSLRTSEAEPAVGTPAGWKPGDKVVVLPSISDKEANEKLGGFHSVRPYLRLAEPPAKKDATTD